MDKETRARRSRSRKSIYAQALSEAEQVLLSEVRDVEGLDEEIALLRVRLATMLAQHPENSDLLLKGVGTLVKAVATKYRLSKKAKQNLSDAITEVLKGIGGALYPEGFEGAS